MLAERVHTKDVASGIANYWHVHGVEIFQRKPFQRAMAEVYYRGSQ